MVDNKITDPEILKNLQEEARFIEQLMNLESGSLPSNNSYSSNNEEEIEEEEEEINEKIENLTEEDLVINRQGEYVQYNPDMVYIEHRGYYVIEEESYWLSFQRIDEDLDKVIQAIDSEGNYIDVSYDYKELVYIDDEVYLNKIAAEVNGYKLIDNKWIKIINNEDEIDKSKLPWLLELEECINQFFPNNWWFQETSYTFNPEIPERKYIVQDFINNSYIYTLIIKFPQIKITNSEKTEHIIEDLYVVLPFKKTGQSRTLIYGFRGKLTNIEFNNSYFHSHLSNRNASDLCGFCLGSGDLVEILHKLSKFGFDKDVFNYFLANLSIYVEWESLEGGPYRRIKELSSKDTVDFNPNDDSSYFMITEKRLDDYLRDNNTILPIEYNNNKKLFDINFNKFESSLSKYFEYVHKSDFDTSFVYKDDDLNEYFTLSNSRGDDINRYKSPLCKLGKEDIFFEIKKIENRIKIDYRKVINPQITNYAKKLLVRRINENYFNKN